MNGWVVFTISMGLPGFAELFAAWRLAFFLKKKGSLLPFLFCLLGGIFDITFSLIMTAILILDGDLRIVLDLSNWIVMAIVVFIVTSFMLWRAASAAISLWFAGVLREETVRSLMHIKRDR